MVTLTLLFLNTWSLCTGNPTVITTAQRLNFVVDDTLSATMRTQLIFFSGDPYPSPDNISWLLNGSIAVSSLPGFIVLPNGGLLIPTLVTYQISGKYTVRVSTAAGVAEDSFIITVGGECVHFRLSGRPAAQWSVGTLQVNLGRLASQ